MMHDIVVVGGGPAGCQVASLLGRRGLDVQLLEEHPAIGEPVDCSGVIGAESFDALGLPGSLKRADISSLNMVSPSGLEIQFTPSSPLAYIVDRAAFDRAIAEQTRASGAVVHLGSRAVDLHVSKEFAEVEVIRNSATANRETSNSGTQSSAANKSIHRSPLLIHHEKLRAKVVILAGGPRYKFQKKLGMGRPMNFLKTAQIETEIQGIPQARVMLGSQVAPGSFAWIIPFKIGDRELARIGVSSRAPALPFLEKLLDRLEADGCLKSPRRAIRSWVIPVAPAPKTYARRVLAVGDAAGQTKPTTGGGIYYGLICAEAAADTVAMAFEKGNFEADTLSRYEARWRKNLGLDMRMGAFFRRLVERLTDRELDDLFRIVQSDGILNSIRQRARFDYHRDVIFFALRHPQLGRIFLRGLFR